MFLKLPRLLLPVMAVIYLVMLVQLCLAGWRTPYFNWDMIPYTAAAMRMDNVETPDLYYRTMQELASVSYSARRAVHGQPDVLLKTPESLRQQIPWYSIKPLYIGASWLAHALGVPWSHATLAVSVAAYALLFMAMACLRIPGIPAYVWMGVLTGWLWMTQWGHHPYLAALSTPDGLGTGLFLLGLVLALGGRPLWVTLFTWQWTLGARPDLLVPASLLIMLAVWKPVAGERVSLRDGIIGVGVLLVTYLAIVNAVGYYGWRAHFYYHFIFKSGFPAEVDSSFSFEHYKAIVLKGFRSLPQAPMVVNMACISGLVLLTGIKPVLKQQWKLTVWMLAAFWVAFAVRFMIFPSWQIRFYEVYRLAMLLIGARWLLMWLRELCLLFVVKRAVAANR